MEVAISIVMGNYYNREAVFLDGKMQLQYYTVDTISYLPYEKT